MNDQQNKNISTSNHDEGEEDWGHHAEVPEDENDFHSISENGPSPSADDLRQTANAHFANRDFDSALPFYTAALETFELEEEQKEERRDKSDSEYVDLKVIYLCNRATCLFRMEMYEESRADALEAVNVSNGKNREMLNLKIGRIRKF